MFSSFERTLLKPVVLMGCVAIPAMAYSLYSEAPRLREVQRLRAEQAEGADAETAEAQRPIIDPLPEWKFQTRRFEEQERKQLAARRADGARRAELAGIMAQADAAYSAEAASGGGAVGVAALEPASRGGLQAHGAGRPAALSAIQRSQQFSAVTAAGESAAVETRLRVEKLAAMGRRLKSLRAAEASLPAGDPLEQVFARQKAALKAACLQQHGVKLRVA